MKILLQQLVIGISIGSIHATNLLGDLSGKDVVVLGPGIIGLSAFFAAEAAGAARVLVIGVGEHRRELIQRHGDTYVDTAKQDALEAVERWSGGRLADVVYECIGLEGTLDQAIRMTKPGGRIMVMGVFGKRPAVDMNTLQEAERGIFTSQAHVDEIATALERLRSGQIDAAELITRVVTLDTLVEDGFEHLIAHGPEHIKVLIRIGGQE